MADEEVSLLSTPTTNYGWQKPTVGGDNDAWGGLLNTDLDNIDSTVKGVSNVASAALPVAGGTLTGPIVLAADPAAALQPATKQYVDGGRLGDNRIINGDMRIDQRGVASGSGGTAAGYTVDRWQYAATQASKGTWGRASATSGSQTGFLTNLGFTSSSAYALLASDVFVFAQVIEADMINDFCWGAANAQPVTLSFWVNSSLTGTFGGTICNQPAPPTRSYPFTFSIPVASTWTRIVITIPGDTTGTWVMQGNVAGLVVYFDLGSGSTFRASAGAWAAGNYRGATGTVSVVGTNAATFNLTGVKLEIGSIATPYNRQSMAKSLADCQRYFQTHSMTIAGYQGAGTAFSGNGLYLPVQMRVAPTTVFIGSPVYSNTSNIVMAGSAADYVRAAATITAAGYGLASQNFNADAEL